MTYRRHFACNCYCLATKQFANQAFWWWMWKVLGWKSVYIGSCRYWKQNTIAELRNLKFLTSLLWRLWRASFFIARGRDLAKSNSKGKGIWRGLRLLRESFPRAKLYLGVHKPLLFISFGVTDGLIPAGSGCSTSSPTYSHVRSQRPGCSELWEIAAPSKGIYWYLGQVLTSLIQIKHCLSLWAG